MDIPSQALLYAALGGLLPALLWLWFWLKEDKRKPEPRGLIILTFIAGMLAVPIVFPLEELAFGILAEGVLLVAVWAAIEEILKFIAAFIIAFRSKFFDEPVDAIIYMVTVALGFAALENMLFLIEPLLGGQAVESFMTGNLRYVGATLLHVVASAAVGIAIGITFYRGKTVKTMSAFLGLCIAIALHTLFNFFIIKDAGEHTLFVFMTLWILVVVVIFFFEYVKRIGKRHRAATRANLKSF